MTKTAPSRTTDSPTRRTGDAEHQQWRIPREADGRAGYASGAVTGEGAPALRRAARTRVSALIAPRTISGARAQVKLPVASLISPIT